MKSGQTWLFQRQIQDPGLHIKSSPSISIMFSKFKKFSHSKCFANKRGWATPESAPVFLTHGNPFPVKILYSIF
jgi:hypothetical protein